MEPRMRFRILSVVSLISVLSACNDRDIPQLKGRYQGFSTTGSVQTQVIAQIPEFTTQGKTKIVIFKIYPTLASAAGEQYSLTVFEKGEIELRAPQIPSGSVRLHLNNNCATGSLASQEISTCWEPGKLRLTINETANLDKSTTVDLTLDESLPPMAMSRSYSLDELVGRAKFINYSVSQEAERLFQAKKNIGVARGNLLPKLSLKALIGVATGDYLSAVGTVLPFLFPGNWYKWEASKDLYQAEKSSFASLRGNEMNMVEGLYYLVLRDQVVLEQLKAHIAWLKQIQATMLRSEQVGTLPSGTADYFGTSIASLERDRIGFESLVKIQYGQLAQATALPVIGGISSLAPVAFSDLSKVSPLDPSVFYKTAQDKSYEVKSLGFLLQAAKHSQQESYYDFFNLEGTNGLGFGTPYQIQVSQSQQSEINKKTNETMSLIELQSAMVASDFNSALESYQLALAGKSTTEKRLNWLMSRLLQGDGAIDVEEFVNQLTDLQFKRIGFIADQATSIQMWLMASAKLNRLLLAGYYSDLEAAIPEEPKEKPVMNNSNNNFNGGGN
jgi:hypothetical protein